MDVDERLNLLSSQMHLEPAEDANCPQLSPRKQEAVYISDAVLPNGRRMSLLKTLLTSVCERDCNYCPFRSGRDFRRATFKPDELANTFVNLHRANMAEGIFLSSGVVKGGVYTQDQLIDTAEILRNKLGYRGYLHLKIMPGSQYDQVERAMQLADRLSINLEAPTDYHLKKLAPHKDFTDELLKPLKWVEEIRSKGSSYQGWNHHWPSIVTQFVVGAVGESDLELLGTTEYLHRKLHLQRAYFSAFHPIKDTPLENTPPASPVREHRLYQSSFLLRDYGFSVEELPFDPAGNLPLHHDPKSAWAKAHLLEKPVELNNASREELLRIPGIGPKAVRLLLQNRRKNHFSDLSQLSKLGINSTRAAPYILLDGKRPPFQKSFLNSI